jgi:glyoxylase-like metal-dependent hydrolase (beta-lactamase superfamily II)
MSSEFTFPIAGPDEDDVYHVYALRYGGVAGRRSHQNFMQRDAHDGPMPLDFYLWIVHNAHRAILVDTGFSPRAAAERGFPIDFDPLEGLTRIGFAPALFKDVVLTHLHFDHAGNIDRFDNARFHIQDGEVAYATGRCMCHSFMRHNYDVEDVVTLVRRLYADRVIYHDGDGELAPGLRLHVFPGHSAKLQGLEVRTPRGPVLLASDASHYYANVLAARPYAVTIDVGATLDTYQRLQHIAGAPDRLIPGHDPKIRKLFAPITVNGVELLPLHAVPLPYSAEWLASREGF